MDQVNTEEKNKTFEELLEANKGLILKICLFLCPDGSRPAGPVSGYRPAGLERFSPFPAGESKFSTWLYKVSLEYGTDGQQEKTKFHYIEPPDDLPAEIIQPADQ